MSCSHCSSDHDETLVRLVYELLDAHDDTAQLMRDDVCASALGADWAAHLDYLQRLQRLGREILATSLANHAAAW